MTISIIFDSIPPANPDDLPIPDEQPPHTKSPTLLRILQAVDSLDFTEIKAKLMSSASENWTEQQANAAEKWYKRFLKLHAIYPEHRNVPNHAIDTFWHAHILDTKKYEVDCKIVFGKTLHHYPYFGLNGDAAERDKAFRETSKLYEREFGENCLVELVQAEHGMDCCDPCTTDNP